MKKKDRRKISENDSAGAANHAAVLLQQKTEFQQQLISLMAHDIMTPLLYISKTASRMLDTIDSMSRADKKEVIEEISAASLNMAFMLQGMLQWVKTQENDYTVSAVAFPVLSSLQPLIALHKKMLAEKNNKLDVEVSDGLVAEYDPVLLRIIIHNLLLNAGKFTSGGKVLLHCSSHAGKFIIEVADTGTGMPQDTAEKLTRYDTVLPAAGTDGEKGPGMGYRIITGILKAGRGTLFINSGPGRGTHVRIEFSF